ncbi:MAG TPA: hypothetical protein VFH39_02950, partial [Candidatus Saccharimonadales bacterium]|nr:hypothetical protein [Candidatus Saccharimonadales bacterium]
VSTLVREAAVLMEELEQLLAIPCKGLPVGVLVEGSVQLPQSRAAAPVVLTLVSQPGQMAARDLPRRRGMEARAPFQTAVRILPAPVAEVEVLRPPALPGLAVLAQSDRAEAEVVVASQEEASVVPAELEAMEKSSLSRRISQMDRRNLIKSVGAALGAFALPFPIGARMGRGSIASGAQNNLALGVNLQQPNYYSSEQPFLNILYNNWIDAGSVSRGTTSWLTSSFSKYSGTVDSNGWPTQIQDGTANYMLALNALNASNAGAGPTYRSGQYYVYYNGTGAVSYGNDATIVSHNSGPAPYDWADVINVSTPSSNGILIKVTSTGAAPNNIRNMALVHNSETSSFLAGNLWSSAFLSRLSNFAMVRTMDWRNTNNATWIVNWSDEPGTTIGGYGGMVPWPIIVNLANTANVHLWVNVPVGASSAYCNSLMSYLAGALNPNINLIVEFSNEVWNGTAQQSVALANGKALWANWATYGTVATYLSYEGYMLQQICNAAVSAFGSANVGAGKRVQVVAGAQYQNGGVLDDVMNCPVYTANGGQALYGNFPIAGCTFAWYFNIGSKHIPASWLGYSSSTFVANAYSQFTSGGLIPQDTAGGYAYYKSTVDYVVNQMATKYGGLPCFGYEGGEGETPNQDFDQLYNNASAGTIARSTTYSTSTSPYRVDGSNNLYLCTTGGTTGSSAPTFNTALGGTTADGTVVWTRVQSATVSWVANWTPTVGDVVKDSNGNFQVALTVAAPTGASAPTWGTTPKSITSPGSQTTDGGVTWTCIRDDSWTALEIAYSRSSQINSAYTSAMNYWKGKSAGCHYFCQYMDCNAPSKYGLWGASESFEDTVSPLSSAPQKWQAIVAWATANPKWW